MARYIFSKTTYLPIEIETVQRIRQTRLGLLHTPIILVSAIWLFLALISYNETREIGYILGSLIPSVYLIFISLYSLTHDRQNNE